MKYNFWPDMKNCPRLCCGHVIRLNNYKEDFLISNYYTQMIVIGLLSGQTERVEQKNNIILLNNNEYNVIKVWSNIEDYYKDKFNL